MNYFFIFLAVGRIIIGVAPIFIPMFTLKLLQFPKSHDNESSRLMARLFGVRDIGLGVLVIYFIDNPDILKFVFIFNAVTDITDFLMIIMTKTKEMAKAKLLSVSFALLGLVGWIIAYYLISNF